MHPLAVSFTNQAVGLAAVYSIGRYWHEDLLKTVLFASIAVHQLTCGVGRFVNLNLRTPTWQFWARPMLCIAASTWIILTTIMYQPSDVVLGVTILLQNAVIVALNQLMFDRFFNGLMVWIAVWMSGLGLIRMINTQAVDMASIAPLTLTAIILLGLAQTEENKIVVYSTQHTLLGVWVLALPSMLPVSPDMRHAIPMAAHSLLLHVLLFTGGCTPDQHLLKHGAFVINWVTFPLSLDPSVVWDISLTITYAIPLFVFVVGTLDHSTVTHSINSHRIEPWVNMTVVLLVMNIRPFTWSQLAFIVFQFGNTLLNTVGGMTALPYDHVNLLKQPLHRHSVTAALSLVVTIPFVIGLAYQKAWLLAIGLVFLASLKTVVDYLSGTTLFQIYMGQKQDMQSKRATSGEAKTK